MLGSALLPSLSPFLPACGSGGDAPSTGCCGVMHFKSTERLWGQRRPGFPGVVAGIDGSSSLAVTPGAVGSAAPGTIFSPSSVRFSSCPSSRAAPPVCLGLLKASVPRAGRGLPEPGEGSLARSPRGVRGGGSGPAVLPCPAPPRRIPIKPQTITHRWAVLDKRLHYFWLPLPRGSWKPGIQGSHSTALFKQVLLIEL